MSVSWGMSFSPYTNDSSSEALAPAVAAFRKLGIRHLVGGSVASSLVIGSHDGNASDQH